MTPEIFSYATFPVGVAVEVPEIRERIMVGLAPVLSWWRRQEVVEWYYVRGTRRSPCFEVVKHESS